VTFALERGIREKKGNWIITAMLCLYKAKYYFNDILKNRSENKNE